MFVNHAEPWFVCMLPPKTGTSTVVATLRMLVGGDADMEMTEYRDNIANHPGLARQPVTKFLPPAAALLKHSLSYKNRQGYSTLVTCRNPFSRMVSLWAYTWDTYYPGMTFQQFLRHEDMPTFSAKHWMCLPQYVWASACCPEHVGMGFKPVVDHVVRCEDIVGSLERIPWVNREIPSLKINAARYARRGWWEYYEKGDAEIVTDLYLPDFDLFSYSTDLEDAIDGDRWRLKGGPR